MTARPFHGVLRRRTRRLLRDALMALCCLGSAPCGWSQPYTPASDDEVLERLPAGMRGADFRRQREELAADPENLRDSVEMAASYLETARIEGDGRFLAYAQAILAPWWEEASPPVPVLVLRARVRSASFEFDRALTDLEAALNSKPDDVGALKERLEVELARGNAVAARRTFETVESELSPAARHWAAARVDRVSGKASQAYADLSAFLTDTPDADPAEAHETLALLADLAWQLGRLDEAETHFTSMRRQGRRDAARLVNHATFLLERGRAAEVLELLGDETGNDAIDLRRAEAWGSLVEPGAEVEAKREVVVRQLAERLEARRRRGDASSLPDDVRYRLRISRETAIGNERARELWSLRRELSDLRLILEAAVTSGEGRLADTVATWIRSQGIQDARLDPWLARVGGGP